MEKIYLIGHGNMQLNEFLNILKEKKVDTLVDVRSVPFSRHVPHFNKNELNEFLSKNNIDYVYMGNVLGGRPPDGFDNYMKSDEFKKYLFDLIEGITGSIAAIMCSEIDYTKCHRRFIASKLADEGFDVEDISKGVQKVDQRTILSF